MGGRVHPAPAFLAEAPELHDRQECGLLGRLTQEVNHLLGDGSVLALGAHLELLVQLVRNVPDVERRHLDSSILPALWRHGVTTVKLGSTRVPGGHQGAADRRVERGEDSEALKEGADDYLVKLLDPDERAHLLSRLKQLPFPPGRGPGGRVSAGCVLHGGIYSR